MNLFFFWVGEDMGVLNKVHYLIVRLFIILILWGDDQLGTLMLWRNCFLSWIREGMRMGRKRRLGCRIAGIWGGN